MNSTTNVYQPKPIFKIIKFKAQDAIALCYSKLLVAIKSLKRIYSCKQITQCISAVLAIQTFIVLVIAFEAKAKTKEHALLNQQDYQLQVETLIDGLSYPWSVAIIGENDFLITEKTGQLRRLTDGKLSEPIQGLPRIFVKSQGGLFDIRPHPQFDTNRIIFFSYAKGDMNANATTVAKAKLIDGVLVNSTDIFTISPKKDTPVHYGGRLLILPDGTLLLTSGDGFDYRESAQLPNSLLGKVIRINQDGSIPADNPFIANPEYHPAIFTLGHRNPQGLAYDEINQTIILHEHGPAGGDEINFLKAGKNYGWPIITQGRDYSGATITPFTEYQGLEQPRVNWTPSIAPSGLAVYSGDMFKKWKGMLLVGALVDRTLLLVDAKNQSEIKQYDLVPDFNQRVRDVRAGPDGAIYLLTDSAEGSLVRISKQ